MLVIAATGNRNRWHVNHAAHKHKIWIWQLASVKLVKIAVENSPLIIFFFSYAHIIELVLSIWLLFLVLMKLSSMFQRQRKFIQSIPISRLNVWEIDSPFRYVCVNGHYSMVFKALYSMSLSILFNRKRKLYFINIWQLNEWMNEVYTENETDKKNKTTASKMTEALWFQYVSLTIHQRLQSGK